MKTLNYKLIFLFLMVPILFTACKDEKEEPGENEVFMQNTAFVPEEITISKGTTITWINKDKASHTVTRTDSPESFKSGSLSEDESFSHTFNSTGTFKYICKFHQPDMKGKVIVE